MDDLLAKAGYYHQRAGQLIELARGEENRQRRRTMLAMAEQYYLLHDSLLELVQSDPPRELLDSVKEAGI